MCFIRTPVSQVCVCVFIRTPVSSTKGWSVCQPESPPVQCSEVRVCVCVCLCVCVRMSKQVSTCNTTA